MVVLSDLHAYENIGSRSKAPSALHMAGGEGEVARLFDGVKAALDEAAVTSVDALLCAGDISDRAEVGALIQVWERLDGLAKKLDARLLAGNHDYASHEGGPVDPKEGLMYLAPLFPAGDADAHRDYFAYAVAAANLNDTRFVLFNSCALHGFFKEDIPEYEHGRVTKSGIKRIREAMAKAPRQTLNARNPSPSGAVTLLRH